MGEKALLLIDQAATVVLDVVVQLGVLITAVCIFNFICLTNVMVKSPILIISIQGSQLLLLDYLLQHHGKISRFGCECKFLNFMLQDS